MHNRRLTSLRLTLLLAFCLSTAGVLAQPGALDPTFGDAGVVVFDQAFPISGNVGAIAFDENGRMVAVGSCCSGIEAETSAAVWRLLDDGTPDLTFGDGGVVTVVEVVRGFHDVLILPSGGALAAGFYYAPPADPHEGRLVRFLADGALDPDFGVSGIVQDEDAGVQGSFYAVRVLSDGRILAAGGYSWSSCTAARYLEDGTPDTSFGEAGGVEVASGRSDPDAGIYSYCDDASFDEDGRIVFGTTTRSSYFDVEHWAGLRFLEDGTLDPSYSPLLDDRELYRLRDIVVAPDGSITIGGADNRDFDNAILVRFTPGGELDPAFGLGGVLELNGLTGAYGLLLQDDGRLLLTGDSYVARVLQDGTLDPSLGEGGIVALGGEGDMAREARTLSLDAQGRIVIGGVGFVARLLNDSTVDAETGASQESLTLSAPAPNPASGRIALTYTLAEPAPVRLAVYDLLGREVALLADGTRPAGEHRTAVVAARLAPGLYFVRLSAGSAIATSRFTVLR